MRRPATFVAVLLMLGLPDALFAQSPNGLSPADSALVERLSTQYKAAVEAKDFSEAVRLLVRVGTIAKNGTVLHKAGHYYETGSEQIPKDDAEAVRVFTLAAGFGDAESQHHIAMRHFEGRGVARDSSRGIRLMEQSADQGYGAALTEMGKIRAEQRRLTEASEAAVKCAERELERIGYFAFNSASDIFKSEKRFIRIREKAPSMAELRGDAVTVDGPGSYDRTSPFALRDITGFIGITETPVPETRLTERALNHLVGVSRQGAEEIERVRAMCTPR